MGFYSTGRAEISPGEPLGQAQEVFTYHFLIGLGTAILTLLVHSIAFTYFMGTGRWVEEVVKAYAMPAETHQRSRQLKSRTFRYAILSMVMIITTTVLGAACDTGTVDAQVHLLLATVTLLCNLWSFHAEYGCIVENGNLLNDIMDDVRMQRAERGLD